MSEPAKPDAAITNRAPTPGRRLVAAIAAGLVVVTAILLGVYFGAGNPGGTATKGDAETPALESEAERARAGRQAAARILEEAEPVEDEPGTTPAGSACGELGLECPPEYSCTPLGTCENATMVAVPAGVFWMGCAPGAEDPCNRDEQPVHEVTLSSFAIDRTEVTVGAYRKCMEAGVCTEPVNRMATRRCNLGFPNRDDHPVNCVTWDQASRYCLWAMGRLPTEAEWEKAARGLDRRRYPWGEAAPTCSRANLFIENKQCRGGTEPVGSHPAGRSPYGALDMTGNALEWVADYYDAHAYFLSDSVDPRGPPSGTDRVLRGGSYGDASDIGHRVWMRYHLPPDTTGQHIGFRCARSLR